MYNECLLNLASERYCTPQANLCCCVYNVVCCECVGTPSNLIAREPSDGTFKCTYIHVHVHVQW